MQLISWLCTAVLESGIIYVCIFAMPLHPYAMLSFQTASFLINVYGHLGYEFSQHRTTAYSAWNPIRYINRTSHHHDHHKRCALSPAHVAFESLSRPLLSCAQRRRLQERQLRVVHHRMGPFVLNVASRGASIEAPRLNIASASHNTPKNNRVKPRRRLPLFTHAGSHRIAHVGARQMAQAAKAAKQNALHREQRLHQPPPSSATGQYRMHRHKNTIAWQLNAEPHQRAGKTRM